MAATLIERNYNTGQCIFAIDTEDDLAVLPTSKSAGKNELKLIRSCVQGSTAIGSNKTYMLSGDNLWVTITTGQGSGDSGTTNYNELENQPIKNLMGTQDEPIVLFNLPSGMYNVSGNCKLTNDSQEFIEIDRNDLYLIDTATNMVRKMTGDKFETYTKENDGTITKDDVATTSIIDEKINEQFVDSSIDLNDIQNLFPES